MDKKNNLPTHALRTAMCDVALSHLGTAAFGSLIITIIQILRTIIECIKKQVKRVNNDLLK